MAFGALYQVYGRRRSSGGGPGPGRLGPVGGSEGARKVTGGVKWKATADDPRLHPRQQRGERGRSSSGRRPSPSERRCRREVRGAGRIRGGGRRSPLRRGLAG